MMFGLPPPTTFAEGQRALYGALASLAGMFCGAAAIAMVCLLFWGGWSPKEEHTIVVIFGLTLGGCILCMAAVIIGLMVGGPVGRFKVAASKEGASIEAENDSSAVAVARAEVQAPPTPKPLP